MDEQKIPALLLRSLFLIMVPGAVLLLAFLNLRTTDALTWLVSAVVIAASVAFGVRMSR